MNVRVGPNLILRRCSARDGISFKCNKFNNDSERLSDRKLILNIIYIARSISSHQIDHQLPSRREGRASFLNLLFCQIHLASYTWKRRSQFLLYQLTSSNSSPALCLSIPPHVAISTIRLIIPTFVEGLKNPNTVESP